MKGEEATLALFDFDGTLITADSFIKVAEGICGRRRLLFECVLTAPWLAAWKLHLIPGGKAKERLFKALYGGMDAEEFRKRCMALAPALLKYENGEMIARLREHQRQGHRVIIISASIGDWVRPVAELLGVSEVIATEAEQTPEGVLTGGFRTPNCNFEEKVRRLRSYLGDGLAEYGTIRAYGDSSGDAMMLSLATPHNTLD